MTKVVLISAKATNPSAVYRSLIRHPDLRHFVLDLSEDTPGLIRTVFSRIPRHDPVFVQYAEELNAAQSEGFPIPFKILPVTGRFYHIHKDPRTDEEFLLDETQLADITSTSSYRSATFGTTLH